MPLSPSRRTPLSRAQWNTPRVGVGGPRKFFDKALHKWLALGAMRRRRAQRAIASSVERSDAPIVVIGAGVVGVMTALALSRRGRRVTVVERGTGAASLCSRGNAGIVAVGHAAAWAAPSAVSQMMRALGGREPGVRITRAFDPALWRFGAAFLRHCTPGAERANTARLQRLARYSRACLRDMQGAMGDASVTRFDGGLYLYDDEARFQHEIERLRQTPRDGVEVLDRAALVAREPSLAVFGEELVGALYSAVDAVGDCRRFTERIAEALSRRNTIEFHYGRAVRGFRREGSSCVAVELDEGMLPAAAVVLATGVETASLCRPFGIHPRIYPVKGYSGTWRITDPSRVPTLPYVDEARRIAVGNYGDRLRVTGFAEFAGHDRRQVPERTRVLDDYVRRHFAAAVDTTSVEFWTGLRPTTPAGPPYLGRASRFDNLWINAGHGTLGWTLAAGSGELLAQALAGEPLECRDVSARARWLDAL